MICCALQQELSVLQQPKPLSLSNTSPIRRGRESFFYPYNILGDRRDRSWQDYHYSTSWLAESLLVLLIGEIHQPHHDAAAAQDICFYSAGFCVKHCTPGACEERTARGFASDFITRHLLDPSSFTEQTWWQSDKLQSSQDLQKAKFTSSPSSKKEQRFVFFPCIHQSNICAAMPCQAPFTPALHGLNDLPVFLPTTTTQAAHNTCRQQSGESLASCYAFSSCTIVSASRGCKLCRITLWKHTRLPHVQRAVLAHPLGCFYGWENYK